LLNCFFFFFSFLQTNSGTRGGENKEIKGRRVWLFVCAPAYLSLAVFFLFFFYFYFLLGLVWFDV